MKKFAKGFTLMELLIVIAIIAVLAVIGVAVFRGVSGNARDSKRKTDVESMAKAYEVKYTSTGSYQVVTNADFAGGNLPQDPVGGNYYNNLGSSNSSFRVCAALESNSSRACSAPSTNCYCLSSAQGSYSSGGSGGSIDHPVSCDPNGTLGLGLVGYWKMNETSWNGTTGEVKDWTGANHGTSVNSAGVVLGIFSNAGSFNGVNARVAVANYASLATLMQNHFTYSLWAKYSGLSTTNQWPFLLGATNTHVYPGVRGGSGYGANAPYVEWGRYPTCDGTSYTSLPTKQNLQDSQWHHLVFTYDGTTVKSYFDGAYFNQTTQNGMCVGSFGDFQIGQNYNGFIDDARVYNRALSASEVSTLYNSGNGCVP